MTTYERLISVSDRSNIRTAARLLVSELVAQGVDRVFCVPGESYLTVLDALYDERRIEVVTCRHESGAGFMAVADAKLTGRPGVVLVSRGPGAMNAAIAVHTAQQDAAPMVLLIGQIERRDRGRRAFQEVDYAATFGSMAKFVAEVHDASLLAQALAQAFHRATTGVPGPSVVVLPEDMLAEETTAAVLGPQPKPAAAVSPAALDEVTKLLGAAKAPLLIAGPRLAASEARRLLRTVAESWGLPVAVSFRQQDLLDNEHPLFAGHLAYLLPQRRVAGYQESDLLLAVGTRLGDATTQNYRFPTAPRPQQRLIHVYDDPEVLGAVFETDLPILAEPTAFLSSLAQRGSGTPRRWAAWAERLHRQHYADLVIEEPLDAPDGVVFGAVIRALSTRVGDDAVLTHDAGLNSSWLGRCFPFRSSHRLLAAISGTMGFGVPAGIAAALRLKRRVITIAGDGGFLMTDNEFATAVHYRLPLTIIVANNGSYGSIRLNQEIDFPGRVIATDLVNPKFAALADAYGARGFLIDRPDQIDDTLDAALATEGPSLVEVRASLERISASATLRRESKA
jgi:acetolactate synthase-1/2/3 large subunit